MAVKMKTKDARLVAMTTCSINGCESPILARGWCIKHYNRWRTHGDPLKVLLKMAPRNACQRWIRDHIGWRGRGCLIWPFARHKDGRAKGRGNPCTVMCTLAHGKKPSPKHEVAHNCGNGFDGCIHPRHLRWATRSENHADKILHGTDSRGEKNYNAALTVRKVKVIRSLAGRVSQSQLAARYGVSLGCISAVIYRATWKHVP